MIRRKHYLAQIRPFLDSDLIKVITGILRCGKSVILRRLSEELGKEASVSDYLVWGGFPKRLEYDQEAMRRYIEEIDETIIYKDIIRRFKIRKESLFRSVADFILRSNSRIVSYNSVYKAISQKEKCSANTIMKYVEYLEKSYAIDLMKQYSVKTKQELNFYKKSYDGDVALNSIRCANNRFDLDHNLENIIYLELLYRGYAVRRYDNSGREIDFIAAKEGKEYLIQVTYSVINEKDYQREFSAFNGLDNSRQKILITNDDIDYSASTVRHIGLRNFLEMAEL